jgi:hypothetical protein
MFGINILKEQCNIYLIGVGFFALFGFAATCLPQLLPKSLSFIASTIALLAWVGIGFVIAAGWGWGPLAKRLNKIAIEEDTQERKKFSKAKQPWE